MRDTSQTATHSFSTNIEGSVSAKYGEARNTVKSITLVAAPGTNMEFTLQWTEQTWFGRIIASGESGNYTARVPISVAQTNAKDFVCPTSISTITTPTKPISQYLLLRWPCGSDYVVRANEPIIIYYGTWAPRG